MDVAGAVALMVEYLSNFPKAQIQVSEVSKLGMVAHA